MTAAGPPSARPRRKAPRPVPGVAEDVLAGHPDRLADALAEAVVDSVLAADGEAAVGVEVAWHRDLVLVTGEIAAGDNGPGFLDLKALAARVASDAGYRWTDRLGVLADLSVTPLTPDDRVARHFSCDQAITVGHASGSAGTGWLPPATFAARRLREALGAVVAEHPDRLGPDGKVLVHLETSGERHRWRRIGVSLQHAPGAGAEDLHRLVLPALAAGAAALDGVLPGLGRLDPALVCLNGAGDFSVGGPQADGGLSGKKLVVDHYGPGVPIGGGALCGKDLYKPDRAGALPRPSTGRTPRAGHRRPGGHRDPGLAARRRAPRHRGGHRRRGLVGRPRNRLRRHRSGPDPGGHGARAGSDGGQLGRHPPPGLLRKGPRVGAVSAPRRKRRVRPGHGDPVRSCHGGRRGGAEIQPDPLRPALHGRADVHGPDAMDSGAVHAGDEGRSSASTATRNPTGAPRGATNTAITNSRT